MSVIDYYDRTIKLNPEHKISESLDQLDPPLHLSVNMPSNPVSCSRPIRGSLLTCFFGNQHGSRYCWNGIVGGGSGAYPNEGASLGFSRNHPDEPEANPMPILWDQSLHL